MKNCLKRAAYAAVFAALSGTNLASAQEMKLADFLPPQHAYQEQVYGVLAEKVAEATGGDVTIKVFPGGALGGNPVEQYDRALNGVAEIAFSLQGYTASKFPMTLMVELPGVVNEQNATDALWDNFEYIKDEYKRVHLLSLWTNGENVLYTRDKAVRSLADVKGLKIRVPSKNAGLVVESWGGVPLSMPMPEIYNALQTGVIDGVLIDSTATYAFRFGEVAKYVTAGMNASISPFALFMNRDAYRDLTDEQQAAFDEIGREISTIANKVQLEGVAYGRKLFIDMEDNEWIDLSPEAAAEFNAASAQVIEDVVSEAEAKGLNARAFVAALQE
ncbi:TRAP-type C4-dicarboxylate transport system substrate-binding protein [Pacificibacter maritimus]|uniref:TRAP-type C4-dicarboxylate transport system substrate-binding protein n=1 Tax=Pacificibacter maritimus TaxID=762213 RepID=A0A3N4UNE6_9RHOB|nr:TRAP transporter substrate-binding protein [Pacificibacter maritimus]RPE72142.1 TRAP-type C4-dicarboxylate transport system substrate-binding protein [Pacificibacter maritimus]